MFLLILLSYHLTLSDRLHDLDVEHCLKYCYQDQWYFIIIRPCRVCNWLSGYSDIRTEKPVCSNSNLALLGKID